MLPLTHPFLSILSRSSTFPRKLMNPRPLSLSGPGYLPVARVCDIASQDVHGVLIPILYLHASIIVWYPAPSLTATAISTSVFTRRFITHLSAGSGALTSAARAAHSSLPSLPLLSADQFEFTRELGEIGVCLWFQKLHPTRSEARGTRNWAAPTPAWCTLSVTTATIRGQLPPADSQPPVTPLGALPPPPWGAGPGSAPAPLR